MKDMHSTARISSEIILDSSTSNEYFEQPHEDVLVRMTMKLLQIHVVMTSLCTL
jgi:hypothetical protein